MTREHLHICRLTKVGAAIVAGGMVLTAATADAEIKLSTNVGGIIPAPAKVCDDNPGAENTSQQGFDEAQGVFLGAGGVVVDIGPGPASLPGVAVGQNVPVDSHMIFLNTPVGTPSTSDYNVTWTFDGAVLGVMSDTGGTLEAATSALLGNPATAYVGADCQYAPFTARGMEGSGTGIAGEGYTISGNQLTVGMVVTEPGDWIRVITVGALQVDIDIKPGSDPNCFNINGHGVIPVAIFGNEDLDVREIDLDSLSFGGLAVRVRGNKGPLCSFEFIDDDVFEDVVCQFEDDSSFWSMGDATATVTGSTMTDPPYNFEGTDAICIVP